MRTITVAPLLLLLIAGTAGCKKYSGEKAAQQRQEWLKSLDDSISSLSARKEADSQRLEELRSLIADRLAAFTQVDNPREWSRIIFSHASVAPIHCRPPASPRESCATSSLS